MKCLFDNCQVNDHLNQNFLKFYLLILFRYLCNIFIHLIFQFILLNLLLSCVFIKFFSILAIFLRSKIFNCWLTKVYSEINYIEHSGNINSAIETIKVFHEQWLEFRQCLEIQLNNFQKLANFPNLACIQQSKFYDWLYLKGKVSREMRFA